MFLITTKLHVYISGAWSIADLQHFASSQQQGTTSVTLSPAPSLDGQAGSPQENGGANNNGVHSSSSASSSNGSAGHNSDDSEYDSVGESPERSPVNQTPGSLSPPPRPASSAHHPHGGPQQQLNSNGSNHHQSTHLLHGGNSNGTPTTVQSTANLNSNKLASFAQGGKPANNNSNNDGGEYNNSECSYDPNWK